VVPPVPAMMMVRPIAAPTMMAIPAVVRAIMMMTVMLNDHRAMVMPAMMIASFSIGCGQNDNTQRDKRCC